MTAARVPARLQRCAGRAGAGGGALGDAERGRVDGGERRCRGGGQPGARWRRRWRGDERSGRRRRGRRGGMRRRRGERRAGGGLELRAARVSVFRHAGGVRAQGERGGGGRKRGGWASGARRGWAGDCASLPWCSGRQRRGGGGGGGGAGGVSAAIGYVDAAPTRDGATTMSHATTPVTGGEVSSGGGGGGTGHTAAKGAGGAAGLAGVAVEMQAL